MILILHRMKTKSCILQGLYVIYNYINCRYSERLNVVQLTYNTQPIAIRETSCVVSKRI